MLIDALSRPGNREEPGKMIDHSGRAVISAVRD
jgi:hypothetical protein